MKFIPLVMESSGAFGKYFIDFINQLSTQVADQRIMSSKQFRHYAHSTIAFTLQRGNSIIIKEFFSSLRAYTNYNNIDADNTFTSSSSINPIQSSTSEIVNSI